MMLYGSICLVVYYKTRLIMQIQHIRIDPQRLHIKNAQSNWLFDTSKKTILSFKTLAMFARKNLDTLQPQASSSSTSTSSRSGPSLHYLPQNRVVGFQASGSPAIKMGGRLRVRSWHCCHYLCCWQFWILLCLFPKKHWNYRHCQKWTWRNCCST